jgi:cleavage and polyadenylation specificity factor subunit 3
MSRLRFTALGGALEIGANSYHLEIDGVPLLLDTGMHPKKNGKDALPLFDAVSERPVEAILLSHCHLDHIGALPEALKRNPHAAVYLSEPSAQLAPRMLGNMASVLRHQFKQGGVSPVYGFTEVDMLSQLLEAERFGLPFGVRRGLGGDPGPIEAVFHHAGHIVGASGIELRTDNFRYFYTGDTCAADQDIIPGAYYPDGPFDVLHMECTTAGDDTAELHDRKRETEAFAKAVREVLNREGVVLVPAFALGRTQELLKVIHGLFESGDIPKVPIWISGLGRVVSQIYDDTRFQSTRKDPGFRLASIGYHVLERDDVQAQRVPKEPCILLATSGMLHPHTPSNLLVRTVLTDPKNAIFFVGYCDPEAPGYKILTAKPGDQIQLEEGGPSYEAKAQIARFHFTAHSVRSDLLKMVERTQPKKIVLIHGGKRSLAWMQAALQGISRAPEILVPEPGVSYEL